MLFFRGASSKQVFGRLLYSKQGQAFISIVLGLGLAMLFQKSCQGDGCEVYLPPDISSLEKYTYVVNKDKCIQYEPEFVPCTESQ